MNDKDFLQIKLLTELLKALADSKSQSAKQAVKAAENYLTCGDGPRRFEALLK